MHSLLTFVALLINVLALAVFIRAVLSWFPVDPRNPFVEALAGVTDPLILPLRRVLPRFSMIDLAPTVAILILVVIGRALASL